MFQVTDATLEGQDTERQDLGVFALPPALDEEILVDESTRVDSEGYTSKVYNCCY